MKRQFDKGDATLDGLFAAVILGFIILAFIIPGKSPKSLTDSPGSDSGLYGGETEYQYNLDLTKDSPYARSVSIGTGNASRAYQPYEEYITVENRGNESVNITGWMLSNAKNERAYESGGNLQRFAADTAKIPRAVTFISPSGTNTVTDIILKNGESAVLTTGSMGQKTPYVITSFKENICSGYLGSSDDYTFTPSLARNCPRPLTEPGATSLDSSCRNFISRMQSCHSPKFDRLDSKGEDCSTCVDGVRLSSSCFAFVKSHYSYAGCIANHESDPNFFGNTWRVFLGQGWPMWDDEHEVIKLFDSSGQLVDYKAY